MEAVFTLAGMVHKGSTASFIHLPKSLLSIYQDDSNKHTHCIRLLNAVKDTLVGNRLRLWNKTISLSTYKMYDKLVEANLLWRGEVAKDLARFKHAL
jgi:hypothetical protein